MKGRPSDHVWTAADDDALVAGYRRGDRAADIARQLGTDINAIHNRAAKLGLRHRRTTRSLAERFFDRVSPEPNSGCWLWTSSTDRNGYGRMHVPAIGTVQASYIALELVGSRPRPGTNVYRRCRVLACVNPDHLVPGLKP